MDVKMIEELLEHVDGMIGILDETIDEDYVIVEELAHELREELESLQDQ